MRIVDNLYNLFCKGVMDYKHALENIKDYNLARIMTFKSSIPHESGDAKLNSYNLDILYSIQFDIENFNYIYYLLEEYINGNLQD
jgi:hypothetical protein